jgi:hypothetical protein
MDAKTQAKVKFASGPDTIRAALGGIMPAELCDWVLEEEKNNRARSLCGNFDIILDRFPRPFADRCHPMGAVHCATCSITEWHMLIGCWMVLAIRC